MKHKTFAIITFIGMIVFLGGFAGLTYYVDPLLHFHAPTEGIEYPLWSERYQNDGISRNFEYDAVILGTSMTENFNTVQFDEKFGTNSIKLPLSGASYNELSEELDRVFNYNDHVKTVFRCLDLSDMVSDPNHQSYDEYPDYLYDDDLLDDVEYLLNKDIFYTYTYYVYEYNKQGGKTTPMYAYKTWDYPKTAKELVENYERKEATEVKYGLADEERQILKINLEKNVLRAVADHPETEFIFYFPPYSILWWYSQTSLGNYGALVETQKIAIDMLLQYDNVKLYSFFDDYIFIATLAYYTDEVHYNREYSEQIIDKIAEGTGQITEDNKLNYLAALSFYSVFDYESYLQLVLDN